MDNDFIDGLFVRDLETHRDRRGRLVETFRVDELPEGFTFVPKQGYDSVTHPGEVRGPHEHQYQTDWFDIFEPNQFKFYLWDNRPDSQTYQKSLIFVVDSPKSIIISPGIVHGYKNISQKDARLANITDKLYRGAGRSEEVDEIRHENDPDSPFRIE